MPSTLMGLAYADLSEKQLVAKVANKAVRNGVRSSMYRYNTVVREYVEETIPPYGMKLKRREALKVEIERQRRIRAERQERSFIPCKESKSRRMVAVAARLVHKYTSQRGYSNRVKYCGGLRRTRLGLYVFYTTAWRSYLLFIPAHGDSPRLYEFTARVRSDMSLFQAVIRNLPANACSLLVRGYNVRVDVDTLSTIITSPTGEETAYNWDLKKV